jgi:hypothetical protein
MRKKLLALTFLAAVVSVSALQAQEVLDEVCWSCDYCFDGTCYGCVRILCPIGGENE